MIRLSIGEIVFADAVHNRMARVTVLFDHQPIELHATCIRESGAWPPPRLHFPDRGYTRAELAALLDAAFEIFAAWEQRFGA